MLSAGNSLHKPLVSSENYTYAIQYFSYLYSKDLDFRFTDFLLYVGKPT